MLVVKPSFEVISGLDRDALKKIEFAGRTCYKSEDKIGEGTDEKFVSMIVNRGHESVIEHHSVTVKFVTDRAVTHQLVRHRLASYSQASQRYCNYAKNDKFGNDIFFIDPNFRINGTYYSWEDYLNILKREDDRLSPDEQKVVDLYSDWEEAMETCEHKYKKLVEHGLSAEDARSVLPNSCMTEIVMTANLRSWKHVFEERCSPAAQHNIRSLMIGLREEFRKVWPSVFNEKV